MSTLIELAAQRLEQLRGTGVATEAPGAEGRAAGATLPERAVQKSPASAAAALDGVTPPAAGATPPATAEAGKPAEAGKSVSQRVELDLRRIAEGGIVTPADPRSRLAEQFRVIKRPLLRNAAALRAASESHGNLIMVTSALPGEGKSFNAVNLAMSIAAELDHTVMLVDADVARPSLPRMLGFEAGQGLLDVLEGRAGLADTLLRTNVEKLTLLPSGTPHPRATELLASDAMTALVERLSQSYPDTILVFDSPPLLLTTEARVLAGHMGQIVLVVEAGRTPQDGVTEALATIEHCEVVGLVLNKAQSRSKGYYSGYTGYGYGYGHARSA